MKVGGVSRLWLTVVAVFAVLSAIFLAPNVFGDKLPGWWSKAFPSSGIRLGLDLRGGVFIQLGVETDRGVGRRLETVAASVREEFDDPETAIVNSGVKDLVLSMEFADAAALAKARRVVDRRFEEFIAEAEGNTLRIFAEQFGMAQIRDDSMEQVRQVIENRVLDFGLVEPSITKLGSDRIVIQVPGASEGDRDRIVDIIKKTAVLEFKIVRGGGFSREEALTNAEVEEESELAEKELAVHPSYEGGNENFFVTEAAAQVTGEHISDARLIFDQFGGPAVSFSFSSQGAEKFGRLTEENIGNRLAIVLDGVVKSAPVIQSRISFEGQITGSFTQDEARDLALILRSGALPVPVSVQQEQLIGPSLGKDSIQKGKLSMLVGGVLVIVFMAFYYRAHGIVANIALGLNMFLIMGLLASLGITLTLPGIAGIVLTLGIAVDGNIIIFERVREEMRAGKSHVHAIETGYGRSVRTILDANVTTLLAGFVLFWFGNGPVKGFAATLCAGIVCTVFSNLIVARLISSAVWREKAT
ncbi:MAG: protein translocase subunit SecD [Candidatus Dadabacteria bacterium]|nr:protein translocase subunit SecD [Candidatus Dadabacteria bacterium]